MENTPLTFITLLLGAATLHGVFLALLLFFKKEKYSPGRKWLAGAVLLLALMAGNWGDYDNDGDLDLYVANFRQPNSPAGAPQANFLFRNEIGSQHNWLRVSCEGVASNRSAIGAKIMVKANINGSPVWQSRFINGGTTTHAFQAEFTAHFGLGDAAVVDSVKVIWPSGLVEVCTEVAVNQVFSITEGDCFVNNSEEIKGMGSFNLSPPMPNPFADICRFSFETQQKESVQIEIIDNVGRRAVLLHEGELIPGKHDFSWQPVGHAQGIYFLKIKAGAWERVEKLVLSSKEK